MQILKEVQDPDVVIPKDEVERLRNLAIKYCMMAKHGHAISSIAKQRAKAIQNCDSELTLCYRAASLLNYTRNSEKYKILETEDLNE